MQTKSLIVSTCFLIVLFVVYLATFITFDFSIDYRWAVLFISVVIVYYLSGYLAFDKKQSRIYSILVNVFVNFTLATVTFVLKNHKFEYYEIFGSIAVLQEFVKLIILRYVDFKYNVAIFLSESQKSKQNEYSLQHTVAKSSLFNKIEYYNSIDDIFSPNIYSEIHKNFDVIILDTNHLTPLHLKVIMELKINGKEIYNWYSYFEQLEYRVDVNEINDSWVLSEGFDLFSTFNKRVKRLFDIVCSLLMLIITSPIFILTALAIATTSRGGVFYTQTRTGLYDKPFKIYKFRSMVANAEKSGAVWAAENDVRITPVGSFIRKVRIDELPQLINVLRGEMSIVGPRPERPELIEEIKKHIAHYEARHLVLPGITGWAQVKYSYGASMEDTFHKLTYDLYYIKHANIVLDIIILLHTVKIVLFGRGR